VDVIAKSALVNFWSSLPKVAPRETAEAAMMEWYTTASKASWRNFSELKKTFNSADVVAGNKVIFDVGGNKYRIVGLVAFRSKRISFCLSGRTPSTMRSTSKTSDVKDSRHVGFESFSNASE
jgi:mRNA interferase HigB